MQSGENLQSLCNQAIAFHQKGDLAGAERLYLHILAIDNGNFTGSHLLGVLRHQQGRNAEALELIGAALKTDPNSAAALSNYGLVLKSFGRFEEALVYLDKALAIRPDYADTWNIRGTLLSDLKQLENALASYDNALAIRPDYADAWNNRATALSDLKRFEEALASYDKALTIAPNNAGALHNVGLTLSELQRFDEALAYFDKSLAIKPGYAEVWNARGMALSNLKKYEDALDSHNKALAIWPDYADALNNCGIVLASLGRLDEARAAYSRSLMRDPGAAKVYLNYANSVKFSAGDPHLLAMTAMRDGHGPRNDTDRLYLDFALAKAYADLKDYSRSFGHLITGNALKRRQIQYDEAATLAFFDRIEATFTANLLREKEQLGRSVDAPSPIFIVGMPRSGTTLVEQILASHPGVHGSGELMTLGNIVSGIRELDDIAASYPELVPSLDAGALGKIGARYLAELRPLAPDALRLTDKMSSNYFFAGLIHLALPGATLIHVARDPVDTCVSCFSRLFAGGHDYTFDLAELGRYYRRYDVLMAHWRRVLPPGRILDIRYEDVVLDLEGLARRIVAHCGLDWDQRCLSFYRTDRPVRTASVSQVRQPIYQSAVGRADAYRDFLGPLKDALAG